MWLPRDPSEQPGCAESYASALEEGGQREPLGQHTRPRLFPHQEQAEAGVTQTLARQAGFPSDVEPHTVRSGSLRLALEGGASSGASRVDRRAVAACFLASVSPTLTGLCLAS